jgi:hypothetical protein
MVKKKKQELANKGVAKSAVSNGKDLLKGVDGRSSLARRYRDVMEALIADQGGPAALSEVRRQLIRRFSACAVLAEDLESKFVNGEEISLTDHALLSSTLVRIAQRLGLDQRARAVIPSLTDYLEAKQEAG